MTEFQFVLSKVLWVLARPDSWIVFGLVLSAIVAHRRQNMLSRALITSTILAVLTITIFPLGNLLREPLERRYPTHPSLQRVDGIVVLGGATSVDLSEHWNQVQLNESAERMTAGLALARRFPNAKVLFTGGNSKIWTGFKFSTEAGLAKQFFAEQGFAADRVVLDPKARNTRENAVYSFELANPQPNETWLLVTSAYHMPRAMATFRKAGWDSIVAYPVDYRSLPFRQGIGWNFSGHLEALNVAIKEYIGLVAYKYLGYAD